MGIEYIVGKLGTGGLDRVQQYIVKPYVASYFQELSRSAQVKASKRIKSIAEEMKKRKLNSYHREVLAELRLRARHLSTDESRMLLYSLLSQIDPNIAEDYSARAGFRIQEIRKIFSNKHKSPYRGFLHLSGRLGEAVPIPSVQGMGRDVAEALVRRVSEE